jgi:flavin-dependent dehydrogenase
MKVHVLVVGAGYTGSVVAERLASAGRRAAPEPAIAAEKRSMNNITTFVAPTRVATLNLAFAAVPDVVSRERIWKELAPVATETQSLTRKSLPFSPPQDSSEAFPSSLSRFIPNSGPSAQVITRNLWNR